jgi:D-serine deaminase-like pyridoxal phosphate-dependent protein
MNASYVIRDTSGIFSPALVFYKDLIRRNIAQAVAMVHDPARLRPHVKTHKTPQIVRLALEAGITKHKCATLAEAEMLAGCGVRDVLLAYNLVGPNCERMARLCQAYPDCRFAATADDPGAVQTLSRALSALSQTMDLLIDIDLGMHRTGLAAGEKAVVLYESLARLPGIRPGGIHAYDGHIHQDSLAEREAAVRASLGPLHDFSAQLERRGLRVPRLVLGGTPTFPIYARLEDPRVECSPGTCFLHDHGYGTRFTDLAGFTPAALILTRVISRPTATRVTFDLGYKAVASDPPAGKRCILLDVPEYEAVLQNEEHLVIETPSASRFGPGDEVFAIPTHVCPTCAMHQQAYVVENGEVSDRWAILARDRVLSV